MITIPGIGTGNPCSTLSGCVVREIFVEQLGRRLECEYQVLFDERELLGEVLRRQFGVDFESAEVGLVDGGWNCRTVFS